MNGANIIMVKLRLTVDLLLSIDNNSNTKVEDIVNELDYNFSDTTGQAEVKATEIIDYKVYGD